MARWLTSLVLLPVAHLLLTRVGVALAVPPAFFTAAWPAAGLALGAVLVLGWRALPGVFLGAFFADVLDLPALSGRLDVVAALGATAQAWLTAWVVQRWCGRRPALDTVGSVGRFIAAVVLTTPLAAAVGTWTLANVIASWAREPQQHFLVWWVSDAMGMLTVTPLVFLLARQRRSLWASRRRGLVLAVVTGYAVAGVQLVVMGREQERLHVAAMLRESARLTEVLQAELAAALAELTVAAHGGAGAREALLMRAQRVPFSEGHFVSLAQAPAASRFEASGEGVRAVVPFEDGALVAEVELRSALLRPGLLPEGFAAQLRVGEVEPRAWLSRKGSFSEAPLRLGDGVWAVELFFPRGLQQGSWLTWGLMVLSLLVSVLVAGGVLVLTGRTAQVERVVRERTQELREARNEADRASRAKGDFLATMSHEIRTPMNGIIGTATLLADTPLSTAQRHLVDVLRGSGDSLLALVNNVLDVSRIEAGKLDLEHRPFDVAACVRNVVDLLEAQARARGVALRAELAPEVVSAPWVLGDELRTRQIVLNLTANALKFTEHGAVRLAVRREGALVIEVIDTGPGIAPEKLQTLFQAFNQLDSSTTRRFGGSGLGLTISRSLAERMGGAISVQSTVGAGSTFTVRLPLTETVAPCAPQEEALPVDCGRLRVLVAEDNPTNRLIVTRVLEKLRIAPRVVENGRLAVDAVEQEDFDLVLMDLHMPVMDGREATRAIRARTGKQPRIFALTADALGGAREAGLAQGLDGYLTKPVKLEVLRAVCVETLGALPSAS